jgi:hypothetical protein
MAREPEEREAPNAPEAVLSVEAGPVEAFPRDSIEPEALALRQFAAYAGPSSWGSWVQVATHNGVASYNIAYRAAVGGTVVYGAVNYYASSYGGSGPRTEVFKDSTTITTGNAWGNVFVSFHGNPSGSAVNGTIS